MKTLDVKLDSNLLEQYNSVFSSNENWIVFNREIKLSSLLNDKKIQFEIDSLSLLGTVKEFDICGDISNSCFLIKKMTFIVKNNLIEKLTIDIKVIEETYMGGILNKILNDFDTYDMFEVVQKIINDNIYFYINMKNPT